MRLLRRQAIPAGSLRPLLLLTFGFLVAGAAVVGWIQRPKDLEGVLIWFAAAIVGHDLVLLPMYSLMDRITLGWLPNGAPPICAFRRSSAGSCCWCCSRRSWGSARTRSTTRAG